MQLTHDVKGISKLILIILLLIDFVLGALLSYMWTMGYYAAPEFRLPSQSSVSIEKVEFRAENATVFNVTILNPSYSPSEVTVEQFWASTSGGVLHMVTNPSLPLKLAPGFSHNFMAYWDWGNYTGQTVNVIVLVSEGSGATAQVTTPFINLTIASVNFYPEASVANFNVTVESMQSQTSVDIETITVNGDEVPTVAPTLPYRLEPNATVTFQLEHNWTDLQGKTVNVGVGTAQGYKVQKAVSAPSPVVLNLSSLVFNTTDTLHFNATIHNDAASPAKVDITQVKVSVQGASITITEVSPPLPQPLQPNSDVLLTCSWNWSSYQGQNAKATINVQTLQGFAVSAEATIP